MAQSGSMNKFKQVRQWQSDHFHLSRFSPELIGIIFSFQHGFANLFIRGMKKERKVL